MVLLAYLLLLSSAFVHVFADVFSSTTQLQHLLTLKQELEQTVGSYPRVSLNVSHPVDAFHLIRKWNNLAARYADKLPRLLAQHPGVTLPRENDETGAALALIRLQRVYNISTEDAAKGQVYGHMSSAPLTADDCYLIGVSALEVKDYGLAAQWLHLAATQREQPQQKQRVRDEQSTFSLSDVYYQLSLALSGITDYRAALEYAKKAAMMDTTDLTVRHWTSLRDHVASLGKEALKEAPTMETWSRGMSGWMVEYESLCRGDTTTIPPQISRPLECRLKPGSAPIVQYKEEILCWQPRICIFRDVISDSEIERIKKLAMPQLKRAVVAEGDTTLDRTSKVSWLWDYDNDSHQEGDFVKGLSVRVGDMTGLDTTTRFQRSSAEGFQVLNYGIGGHYAPHLDTSPTDAEQQPEYLQLSGDRITTFMFYLSDITEGGATVFPEVGARVPATKGAAAFWYNLHPNGRPNKDTLHAGCPVLVGEKWVANKWIHEYGQEFLRPCYTDPNAIWNV